MKKTNIMYWTFTGLFAALMLLSAVPNVLMNPESVKIFTQLGYPVYLIPFLGGAKLLGALAIIIPGFPRLKEWAYAGLFFDLVGATYSGIMVGGLEPAMAGMLIFFGLGASSYVYYHKRQRLLQENQLFHSAAVTA